jgi:hypothetical protein
VKSENESNDSARWIGNKVEGMTSQIHHRSSHKYAKGIFVQKYCARSWLD